MILKNILLRLIIFSTFSLSQKSKVILVSALPWREKEHAREWSEAGIVTK